MNRTRIKQTTAAIAACATVAAVVGIATGAAAPSKSNSNGRAAPGGPPEFGYAVGPPPGAGPATASAVKGKGHRMMFRVGPPGGRRPVIPTDSRSDLRRLPGSQARLRLGDNPASPTRQGGPFR